jgi:hypothetical protein
MLHALVLYLTKRLNELRAQPTQVFPPLTAQDVRAGVIAEYRAL